MHVLIVENNHELAENVGTYLEQNGHSVDVASDGRLGLQRAETGRHDVIVLDLGLPVMDGLDVCENLRRGPRKATPILMLTARDSLVDKQQGFTVGTDDYLIKPFALSELQARLHALVRRFPSWKHDAVFRLEGLEVDLNTYSVSRDGERIELKLAPMRILALLCRASPWLVARSTIEQEIWGGAPPGDDVLRAHIYAIRNAIDRKYPVKLLQTAHGVGYRLVAPEKS